MAHDDKTWRDAAGRPGLAGTANGVDGQVTFDRALHEIADEAGRRPGSLPDDELATQVARAARIVRRRQTTARVGLAAACVALLGVVGGVGVAHLPRPADETPAAAPAPTSEGKASGGAQCGGQFTLPQSLDGVTLTSDVLDDGSAPSGTGTGTGTTRHTYADARALAVQALDSIEVTNVGTTTIHDLGGGNGFSETVLVRDGVVVGRTAVYPASLQAPYSLAPGQSQPASGMVPSPCAADGDEPDDPDTADLPAGDYDLYALLNPSENGASAQAVGGPWAVRIGTDDGSEADASPSTPDALPRCGAAFDAPLPTGPLTLVSDAYRDSDGRALPHGTVAFSTDLSGSLLPLEVRNDGAVHVAGSMSTATSFTIVHDGIVVAVPRSVSSPVALLDLDPGAGSSLAPVAPEPCEGAATLASGDYDVYASIGAHLDDGTTPLATGGPWRIRLEAPAAR